jgi:hypothetical protein
VLRPTTHLEDLFLCEACEAGKACEVCELGEACWACEVGKAGEREGDLELTQGSGKPGPKKHTEDHHLIRCLAPEKDDDALSSTERSLISLESRFGGLIQDLTTRIETMEKLQKQLLHKLSSAETVA